MLFSKVFWADALERAIRAGAWCLLGLLGADATVIDRALNWADMLTTAGYAALLSLLASVASNTLNPASASDSASLLPASVDPPQDKGSAAGEIVLAVTLAMIGSLLALWIWHDLIYG